MDIEFKWVDPRPWCVYVLGTGILQKVSHNWEFALSPKIVLQVSLTVILASQISRLFLIPLRSYQLTYELFSSCTKNTELLIFIWILICLYLKKKGPIHKPLTCGSHHILFSFVCLKWITSFLYILFRLSIQCEFSKAEEINMCLNCHFEPKS